MHPATLLAVDDNPDNLFVLCELLRQSFPDITVLTARDADEAMARAMGTPIDCALIDVQMPRVNGIELCRRLQSLRRSVRFPIILITAHATTSALRANGLEAGADDFISRPIDNVELLARIRVMLRIGKAEEALRSANATLEQRVLEATQALREERDFASAVLATAGALVIVMDREGRIVRFNRACEQTSGYTANEAIGRRVWDFLLTPEDVEPVKGVFRDLRDGYFPNTYENFWVAKDASRRWIAWSSTALVDAHGKVEYVIGTGINMTERLRLEEQLLHSQKMEAIGTLAAGVAHDFNNLLTAILGYAELARRGVAPGSEAMLSLTGIETAAMEAGGVARSLLTFSRKAPNRKAPVRLGRLVEASAKMLRRMVPAAIEIVTDVARADDFWVHADATQLQQVVMNLAVNARDAMPNGGVLRLTVHAEPPDTRNAAPTAVMVVQDTGTGMSAEVLARVFEPFFTTKPRERGTGLGMAVVHGIVTDHGGRIEIESKEGYGTQVSVRFPCCAAPADDASPPEPPPAIRGLGETILVVDDNPQVLAIITSTLRSAGYQTVSASDGDAAMTTFEANRERTRLVILDLDLPRRSGLACLNEMRKHRSDLPALLISGSIEADLESAARNDTRILRKPFQVQELGRIVSELLNGGTCDESVDAG